MQVSKEKSNAMSILSSGVINHKNETVDFNTITSTKLVAFYFSAHWCPPCRNFTPLLAKFYNEVNQSEKQLEIIFVTSDQDLNSFTEYFGHMPWLSLPFGDERIAELKKLFGVRGIPMLVVLKDGVVVSTEARNQVCDNPSGCLKLWLDA